MQEQSIYQKALTKFGVDKQLEKLEQELIELLLALSHKKEGRHDHNVHEELADVEIMINQIKPLFNESGAVDNWKQVKLARLKNRVT